MFLEPRIQVNYVVDRPTTDLDDRHAQRFEQRDADPQITGGFFLR
jgi:hypothetical protein